MEDIAKGEAPSRQAADGQGLPPPVGGQQTWRDYRLAPQPSAIAAGTWWKPDPEDWPNWVEREIRTVRLRRFYDTAFEAEVLKPVATMLPSGERRIVFLEVPTLPGLQSVLLDKDFVDHIVLHHSDKREEFARHVLLTLRHPAEVWFQEGKSTGTDGLFRMVYLARFEDDRGKVLVVQKVPNFGSLAWTFYPAHHDKRFNKLRTGLRIHPIDMGKSR